MRKIVLILLACLMLTSCGKSNDIDEFKDATDNLTETVDRTQRFMELQEEFEKLEGELKADDTSDKRQRELLDELKKIQKEQEELLEKK